MIVTKMDALCLIITAIKEEKEALNQYSFQRSIDDDGISYYFKEILNDNQEPLFIIHYNIGEMGSAASAATTSHAIKTCNPEFIILLGISAGFQINNVEVGDIIIATQIQYYSRGKITDNSYKLRPRAYTSDYKLIEQMSCHNKVEWSDLVPNFLDITKKVGHIPTIHAGTVLSGEEIVNSKKRVDELLRYFSDALGIEMESFGTYKVAHRFRIPIIMVRGVSDLADGTKSDSFKTYASDIAAAFVISFLEERATQIGVRGFYTDSKSPSSQILDREIIPTNKTLLNEVYDAVDDAILNFRFSNWSDSFAILYQKINTHISDLVGILNSKDSDSDSKLREINNWVTNIDMVFRNAYMKMLSFSFFKTDMIKARMCLEEIQKVLDSLKVLNAEVIYVNWIADIRAFFLDDLKPFLDSLTIPIYDRNSFWFVESFCQTLNKALINSITTDESESVYYFSFDFGLSFIHDIIISGLKRNREFHIGDDDFSYPSPFSVIVEPLMRGLNECVNTFSVSPSMTIEKTIDHFFHRIRSLVFRVLIAYRNNELLDYIHRSTIDSLLTHRMIIGFDIEQYWEDLFSCDEPRGFDYVIQPMITNIEKNSDRIGDYQIEKLLLASLRSFIKQKGIYAKVAQWLKLLCFECINGISDDSKRKSLLLLLVRTITSNKNKKKNWLDIADCLNILGWEVSRLNKTQELRELITKLWYKYIKCQDKILDHMKTMAHAEIGKPYYLYSVRKWQKMGALEVLKMVDKA